MMKCYLCGSECVGLPLSRCGVSVCSYGCFDFHPNGQRLRDMFADYVRDVLAMREGVTA